MGDLVLWNKPKIILGKLDLPRLGPYPVLTIYRTSAKIKVGNKIKLVPLQHLSLFKKGTTLE